MDLHRRWKQHKNQLKNKKHVNLLLQRSWDKYGEFQFKFELIELVDSSS